jgi:membrane protein DedA with SNARE-associated domain
MGIKIGEQGLERWVPEKRLVQVRAKVRQSGAIALAVLDLIPPPFPFTPFMLAAGALEVRARTFFVTLVVCRLLRFGLEAALALVYGDRIMRWFDSDLFHDVVMFFIALAVLLTLLSIVQVVRATRPARRRAAI